MSDLASSFICLLPTTLHFGGGAGRGEQVEVNGVISKNEWLFWELGAGYALCVLLAWKYLCALDSWSSVAAQGTQSLILWR